MKAFYYCQSRAASNHLRGAFQGSGAYAFGPNFL